MEPKRTRKPQVVVVNDDVTQLNVLSGLLNKAGLEVQVYDNAREALEAFIRGEPPDLIVTDLYMPVIDGWRFCRLLRSPEYLAFNQVPILVVSATFSGEETRRITADLGANAFLPAPVDARRFIEQARELLAGVLPQDHLRVLIVEDSKTLAGVLKNSFEAHGYRADKALTAKAAVEAFKQSAYDVAVLDYHLPDGLGDALLNGFKESRPDCVCIMMTTDPGPELALEWMKKGAAAYLRKPFDPEYLIEVCAAARRERALIRVENLLEERTRELRESENKYRSLIENINDIVFSVDSQGLFTYVSPVAERIFGYTPEEVIGQSFSRFIFQDDLPMLMERFHMMLAGEVDPADYRIVTKTGDVRWVRSSSRPVMVDGKAVAIQGLISDITERKQIENAQLFLLQCGWSNSGEDFFQSLARYLAETLGMDYVCIDRLEGDGLAAKTVAIYFDGKFEDNLAYALKDTPCGDVVGKTICSFPGEVRHLFPRDVALQEMKAESYCGTTLWSSRGQPIGLIAVIGRRPRADLHLAEAILNVVAIRAAGELERSQAEAETKRLASFPMLSPNFVVEVDVAGHVHFCNPVVEQMFPDLCQRGPGHPWLADWEPVVRNLCEGGSKSMAREVPVDGKWYEQTMHFVEDGERVRIYGMDITARKQASEALLKAYAEVEKRVVERTAELVESNKDLELEIVNRKKSEELLHKSFSEIQTLKNQLEAENVYFRQEAMLKHHFDNVIGQSNALKYVLYRAEQVAPTNATVLILGETGTGKGVVAGVIHQMSPTRDRALVTVNCAALPANLIESELFGREKGAFTGADTRQIGRFEIANGSTICLDEVAELPLEVQAKLLRVIQHNEFERLGSSRTIKVNVRIVATTNRNLEGEVRKGKFRQDLFYRLNVFPITVPPLRQRKEDIPLLVEALTERYARKLGKHFKSINKDTLKVLQEYPWPGNIRELENVIERAVILCPGPVLQLIDKLETSAVCASSGLKTMEETERGQIRKTLSETRWRINGKKGAAAILDLHPSTLRAKMHKLGIRRPEI